MKQRLDWRRIVACLGLVSVMLGMLVGCAAGKAKEVAEQIDWIGNITLASEAGIAAAENAYAALSDSAKGKVQNYSTLVAARESYNRIVDAYTKIESIGAVSLSSKSAIERAEAACSVLSEKERAEVTNYGSLSAARESYDRIFDAYEKIESIGAVSLSSKSAIEKAEAACKKLSELEKTEVTNYDDLSEARGIFDRIYHVYLLIEEIGTVHAGSEAAIIKAEEAYKALAIEERASIINYASLVSARTSFDALPKVVQLTTDNIGTYFDIGCSMSTVKTSSYHASSATTTYYTTATFTASAKLIKTVDEMDAVSISIKITYSLDKLSYGTSTHTITLTIRPDAFSGKGSASSALEAGLSELIGGPSLSYPKFKVVKWEIVAVSGTVTA